MHSIAAKVNDNIVSAENEIGDGSGLRLGIRLADAAGHNEYFCASAVARRPSVREISEQVDLGWAGWRTVMAYRKGKGPAPRRDGCER